MLLKLFNPFLKISTKQQQANFKIKFVKTANYKL